MSNKDKAFKFFYSLFTGVGLVAFFRGVWGLLDYYLLPGNELLSYSFSVILALFILFVNDFSLSELGKPEKDE